MKVAGEGVQVTKEASTFVWIIFALLDPNPDSEYGSGSSDLIESGSILDPDPKPCFF